MNQQWKTITIITSLFIIFIIGVVGLGGALTPLIIASALSYLLFPLIKKIEGKGLKRVYSVSIIFVFLTLILVTITASVIPGLVSDGHKFLTDLPQNTAKAINRAEDIASNFGHEIEINKESIILFIKDHISSLSTGIIKSVSTGIKTSFGGISSWLVAILNLFLIPLFFFYVITDYEKHISSIKSLIPKSFIPKLSHYSQLTNTVLSGYIRGQLLVALCLAILYAIGLSIVGLKFGILIGIVSGLISIIPYAGFTLGFLAALVVGLAHYSGIGQITGIIIVFVIVQTLEGLLITPKLVGDKVGLSAFTTMLVLIVGGNLFGLIGMLIAIPIAAILKSVLSELKSEYQQLDFYKD